MSAPGLTFSPAELIASWATVVSLLAGVLGAAWRAGSALRGIRDDLRDLGRRVTVLEDWYHRVTEAAGLWGPDRPRRR